MENSNGAYTSLHAPLQHDEYYAWWWRLISFASSWMILAGFLVLPPLTEDDPKLRGSPVLFIILLVVFLTAGFLLSALLLGACRSWQYRLDAIVFPALCSSSLGLLAILYNFAISSRYQWHGAAIAGTIVGVVATIAYLSLAVLCHRRASSASTDTSILPSHQLRNLVPSRLRRHAHNPRISVTGEAPVEIVTGQVSADDELTRQQMLNLLKQRDNMGRRPSDVSLRSTYNIEMPQASRSAEERLGLPAHVQQYYSPLSPQAHAPRVRAESSPPYSGPSPQSTVVNERDNSRSRDARRLEIEHAEERERSRSRDVRRMEIESGQQ